MIHSKGYDHKNTLCHTRERMPTIVHPAIQELRAIINCPDCLDILAPAPKKTVVKK